ncbi:nitroreductase family protein [Clostridium chrysemydis]|uniref:nitroreductase family protein n=1 Tax=Clostridium chrysemydis TaxID=2665504 RepID=UPI003F3DF2D6
MEFFDVIKKRRSISKYKSDEVLKGSIDNMIQSAMRAPSWKNKTSFKIILVDDKNKKESLGDAILNKDDKAKTSVLEAPLVSVFISEPDLSGEVLEKEYYLVDCGIAMEHFVLAATAEGYGTMWIGALDEALVKKVLEIPEKYKVVAMTPVGIPAEEKEHNKEKDKKDYVFLNKFKNPYLS